MTKQEAPNYRDLIKKPIALKDMKSTSKRNEYKCSEELMMDVRLMRQNAEIFNGMEHPISKLAKELEEMFLKEF